jgi:hypothetical protein
MTYNLASRTALALAFVACANPPTPSLPYPFTSLQRNAVTRLLASNEGWQLATDSDYRNKNRLRDIRTTTPTFEPYLARQSSDGDDDFAVALTRDSTFKVFYFRHSDGKYLNPQEVSEVRWLNDGVLVLKGDTLDLAPWASDEIFRFVWNASRGEMVFEEDSSKS